MKHIKHVVASQVNIHVMTKGWWSDLEAGFLEAQALANRERLPVIMFFTRDGKEQEREFKPQPN